MGQPGLLPLIKLNIYTRSGWPAEASRSYPTCGLPWPHWTSQFEELMVFSDVVIFAAWYSLPPSPPGKLQNNSYDSSLLSPPVSKPGLTIFTFPAHCPLFMFRLQPKAHDFRTVYLSATTRQWTPRSLGSYLVYSVSSSLALGWQDACGMNKQYVSVIKPTSWSYWTEFQNGIYDTFIDNVYYIRD